MHLVTSLLIMYGILVLTNVPAPLLGLKFESKPPRLKFEAPGFIIPIAWFILFTLLGIALHRLHYTQETHGVKLVLFLAVLCASYAYYTLGLARLTGISALWYGLVGNIVVIVAAALVVNTVAAADAISAWLIAPVIAWTVYATYLVIGEMRMKGML